MGRDHQDDSVSPLTRTPQLSPSASASQSALALSASKSDSLHPPSITAPSQQPGDLKRATSAQAQANGAPKDGEGVSSGPENGGMSELRLEVPRIAQPSGQRDSDGALSPASEATATAPPSISGSRSVQFARPDALEESIPAPSHTRHGSWDGPETPGKSRSASFLSLIHI